MHKHNDNYNSTHPQSNIDSDIRIPISQLTPRQLKVITELVTLYHDVYLHPDDKVALNLLCHFFLTIQDRLTDDEYAGFLKWMEI